MGKRAAELEAEDCAMAERAAEAADAEEDKAFGSATGAAEELPDWIAWKPKKKRAEKIRGGAGTELEAEARAAAAAKARAQAEAEERRRAEGRKKPGKPAAPPSEEPDPKAQKNFTRSRKPHHENQGRLHPGLQCAGGGRRDGPGDRRPRARREAERSTSTRRPIVDAIEANLGRKPAQLSAGRPAIAVRRQSCGVRADATSTPISPQGEAQHPGEGEGGGARIAAMREKIRAGGHDSPSHRLRKQLPEPVFGQIKQARGCRQFLLRGVENVAAEWGPRLSRPQYPEARLSGGLRFPPLSQLG